jgi:vitamin B12 transporter
VGRRYGAESPPLVSPETGLVDTRMARRATVRAFPSVTPRYQTHSSIRKCTRVVCTGVDMKTMMLVLPLSLAIVLPFAVRAETPPDTIIVTATRTEIPLNDAIVPVTVISREQIEQSLATDLSELLRFEAGIDIGRNGGPGQPASLFLRGTESNHTLVLVDGVRINPGTIGGAAVQNIAPEIIDRIEVVKGTRSALFGTDAIGGVVNIITRRSTQSYAEASVGGGSFDTRSGFVSGGSKSKNGEFGVSFNWQETDGFPVSSGSDIDRGYENLSANVYWQRRFANTDLSIRHWRAEGTVEYLDFFGSPLDQDFENASTAVEVLTSFGERARSKVLLSHIIDDISQNQSDDFVESTRTALDWQLSLESGNHTWVGGLYLVDEKAETLSFGSGFAEDTSVKAVFVEHLWSSGRHQTFAAVRRTDHETMSDEDTWNLEYAFDLSDRWTLNIGGGHAFRAPDATDRYGFGGDPALKPEVADEVQVGLRFNPAPRHRLGLELYRNDVEDLIEFDLDTFRLRNIGQAEIRGAQFSYEYSGDGLSFRSDLVKQKADNATDGLRLLRRAEESLTLSLIKDMGAHAIGLSVLASGDRADFGGVILDNYVVANLTGQIAFGDRWRLNIRIENLLDEKYETAAGFTMQERSGFFELRYGWN